MEAQQLNTVGYSEKSFVVYGELTRTYKDNLKGMGGKFNGRLKPREEWEGGAGWIFSLKNKDSVLDFVNKVNSGEFSPTDLPVNAPQLKIYQWVKFKIFIPKKEMKVTLKVNGEEINGKVTTTEMNNNLVDTVYIDFDDKTSMAVIQNGKWKLLGYMAEHSLFFTEN